MALLVQTEGHEELAALAEVLRHFFGPVTQSGDRELQADWTSDLHLISKIEPPVDSHQVRSASRLGFSDEQVNVTTRVLGSASGQRSETAGLHEVRRLLRHQLYGLLSQETGICFPWGTLTGIRPTQVALEVIHEAGPQAAQKILEDYWQLAPSKARLAVRTALAEEARLSQIEEGDAILYAGLPFCPSRCLYCSFITQDAGRQEASLASYVHALIREAREFLEAGDPGPLAAVYYGGGTPTSLPAPLFRRYVQDLLCLLPLKPGTELTMEAGRPDTLDREKLEIIQQAGFHKLCINPQTMRDETLRAIGRRHTSRQTLQAFQLARKMGFSDINMDLIAGLPGETGDHLLESVKAVMDLGPQAITLHTLSVKKGSYLDRLLGSRDVLLPDPALMEAVEEAQELLNQNGYAPYYLYKQKNCRSGLENTGFAREGSGSLYNVAMMSDQVPVIGLGSGATSKVIRQGAAKRLHNPKDLLVYMDRLDLQVQRKKALFGFEV